MDLPMPLSLARMRRLKREGYLVLPPGYLGEDLLERARRVLADLVPEYGGDVAPGDCQTRALAEIHKQAAVAEFASDPDVLGLARQVLGPGAHVVGSRLDVSVAREGSQVGGWHRDVPGAGGMGGETPPALNLVLLLDDAVLGGPVAFVPRTHGSEEQGMSANDSAPYRVSSQEFARLAGNFGIVNPPGPAGSVLVFDSRILHLGIPNLSPFPRRTLAFSYVAAGREDVGRELDESLDCPARGCMAVPAT